MNNKILLAIALAVAAFFIYAGFELMTVVRLFRRMS